MSLRHSLILAINTSILLVLFVFTAWLYRSSKAEVESQVAASLERAALMSDDLAKLREERLSSLAQSIAASPLLKSALATSDRDTVEDVLSTVASKNRLAAALIMKEGKVAYRSKGTHPGDWSSGRFTGTVGLEPGVSLALSEEPTIAHLNDWSKITSVEYALSLPGGEVKNVSTEEVADAYARTGSLLGGRLKMTLYAPRAPFWRSFEARRDSLVVLGGVLFFFGLILSVGFALLIEKHAGGTAGGAETAQWRRLLADIEEARGRLNKV